MIYDQYAEAWDTQNADLLGSLCHPNLEMIMHSSGTVVSKAEYIERLGPMMQKIKPGKRPCLVEK